MAQFLRPNSNVTQSFFTGGYTDVDEATPSDSDFAYSANNTTGILRLGVPAPPSTPDPAGSSTFRYRIARTNAGTVDGGGSNSTVTANLLHDGTSHSDPTTRNTDGTWTTYEWTFSNSLITDWSTLKLDILVTGGGGSPANRRGAGVSWMELEASDPAAAAYTLTAAAGSFTESGVAAGLYRPKLLTAATGSYIETGVAATLYKGMTLSAAAGAFTETGVAAGLRSSTLLSAAAGAFTESGVAAGVLVGRLLTGAAGAYVLDGKAATIAWSQPTGYSLVADAGLFALGLNPASLLKGFYLGAAAGSYSLTGWDASTLRSKHLVGAPGALSASFNDAGLIYYSPANYVLSSNAGAFTLTGVAATFAYGQQFVLAANAGSFALSGQPAVLLRTHLLGSSVGSYTLTGQPAGLLRSHLLGSSTGGFTLSGIPAGLVFYQPQQYSLGGSAGSFVLSGLPAEILFYDGSQISIYSDGQLVRLGAIGSRTSIPWWEGDYQTFDPRLVLRDVLGRTYNA